MGQHNYAQGIRAKLGNFLKGSSKAMYVDPALRFVLFDAQDEVIRGDAVSGELQTGVSLDRISDHGLRRSKFVSAPNPVFIFERGVAVFNEDGWLLWCRNDLRLDHHFRGIEGNQIVYFSELKGEWSYDLFSGDAKSAAPRQ